MVVQLYSCPSLANCTWQGQRHDIIKHFQQKHIELLLENNEFKLAVPSFDVNDLQCQGTLNYDYAINYLLCDEQNQDGVYLVQVNVVGGKAKIQLRYSGCKKTANKTRFSLQVRCGDMSQFSNIPTNHFYSAVKNQPGMIEVDALFLRNAWKLDELLVCRIYFEDLHEGTLGKSISTRRHVEDRSKRKFLKSKSLEDVTSDLSNITEERPVTDHDMANQETSKSFIKKQNSLTRSSSEQYSRMDKRSLFRLSKRKSFFKSDQSIFYTDQDYIGDSIDCDSLINLADDRIALLKDYRCNLCQVYIAGPIYRCINEHSICHACLEEIGVCVCQAGLSADQRSDTLEKTRDYTKLPCRFEGCPESTVGVEFQLHQVQCSRCVYMCPECKTCIGKYGEVEKHFRIVHPSVKRVNSLENSFPPKTVLLVIHPQGIFYCRSADADGTNCLDWQVEQCGHVKIYFESEVLIKKTNYVLTLSKNEKNILKRSVSFKEKKPKTTAVLKIKVYQSQS